MNKTGIEWCDMTWNPVTGCRHECEYCYARRIAARFGTQLPDGSGYPEAHDGIHRLEQKVKGNPYPYLFEPTFLPFRLKEPERKTQAADYFRMQHGRPVRSMGAGRVDRGSVRGLQESTTAPLPVPHKEPTAVLRPRIYREAPGGAEFLVRHDHHRPG